MEGATRKHGQGPESSTPGIRYVPDDADGNMTAKISKKTGDSTVFTWDIENKLVEVRKPGMIAKYVYDALGRRMSKTVNGETKKFGYDGDDLILEMNENDSIIADYTHGPGIDNPLMMNREGANYYYVKDGLGSVTALADSTGSVVHEYNYSVFGSILMETGMNIVNPFTYTSREYDAETGNYYYRARYYNPEIGRFLSEDPLKFNAGDLNLYRYVFNSPINFLDPFGLEVAPPGTKWEQYQKYIQGNSGGDPCNGSSYIANEVFKMPPANVKSIKEGYDPYSIHTVQYPFVVSIPLAGRAAVTPFYTMTPGEDSNFDLPFVNTYIIQYDVSTEGQYQANVVSQQQWLQPVNQLPMMHHYYRDR